MHADEDILSPCILVVCLRFFNSLCSYIGWSVGRSVGSLARFERANRRHINFWCFRSVFTSINFPHTLMLASDHLHATGVDHSPSPCRQKTRFATQAICQVSRQWRIFITFYRYICFSFTSNIPLILFSLSFLLTFFFLFLPVNFFFLFSACSPSVTR